MLSSINVQDSPKNSHRLSRGFLSFCSFWSTPEKGKWQEMGWKARAANPGSMPRMEAMQQMGRKAMKQRYRLQAGWRGNQDKGGRPVTMRVSFQGHETQLL